MFQSDKSIRFFLKKPKGSRKSYSLVKYIPISRNKKEYVKLTDTEQSLIDSVNDLFVSKTISMLEDETRIEKFLQAYAKKNHTLTNAFGNTVISDYNRKILNKFWKDNYEDRELVDPKSPHYDFQRTLKYLDPVAVDADVAPIKKKLSSLPLKKIKRTYARLNEIRSYLGIEETLATSKTEVQKITYITLPELKQLLANIKNEDVRDAIATLFATGLRLGEALGLEQNDLINGDLNLEKQLKRDGTIAPPKRNKVGKVIIIDELKPYVTRFLKIKNKGALRNLIQNTIVELSNAVLERHIHAHDLRHSHAIYLLSKGASLTLISLQLRNRIEVCQKYYAGFCHTDGTLSILKALAK